MNNEVVSVIIKAVVAILSVVVTTVVVPYLKNKLGENKYAELTNYVEWAVRCAEQIFTKEEFEKKKEYVMKYIIAKSAEMNIALTEEDINILIEGVVNLVKHDKE